MSKRSSKKGSADRNRRILKLSLVKFDQEIPEANHSIHISASTFNRWNKVKLQHDYKSNDEFVSYLLDYAEEQLNKKSNPISLNSPSIKGYVSCHQVENSLPVSLPICFKDPDLKKKIFSKEHHKTKVKRTKSGSNAISQNNNNSSSKNCKSLNANIIKEEPKIYHNEKKEKTIIANLESNCSNFSPKIQKEKEKPLNFETENNVTVDSVQKKSKVNIKSKKKHSNYDIRSAPDFQETADDLEKELVQKVIPEVEQIPESPRVAIKIKLCHSCNSRHMQDNCPLQNPLYFVEDAITFDDWSQQGNIQTKIEDNDLSTDDQNEENKNDLCYIEQHYKTSYALMSLPNILYLDNNDLVHGPSVFTNSPVEEFTQFGPLNGKTAKEVDIPEDFSMKHLWQIFCIKNQTYLNTENLYESNWIRFMRPAPNRDSKNVVAVCRSDKLYLVTTRKLDLGEELLFWQDDGISNHRKKMEKLNCGGCNITFAHPLYYRMHCSIFHDVRYSLTIRKYHCKICGAAVLGKENIMKHAADLHNGQGAYQCQFCKKFFLRLNYLEMHRTYGCSANPHRSRPLCDFCGRKFCQPQKLKVHIKRMHSDMAEVLKEFQCKNCLKLLGSRAALQRHLKEVHNKQMDCSFSCKRCGKLFQNKSNLKIHMLTHSGIKPFKCKEEKCAAAFTTKQCLQFHYKKVHGFAEEIMPKIERSIEYTFEAYSGLEDEEGQSNTNLDSSTNELETVRNSEMSLDDSSDMDDISLADRMDEPPSLHSPIPITSEQSSRSNPSPPLLEAYTTNLVAPPAVDVRILSKGSKKWLGEDPQQMLLLPQQSENPRKDNHMYSVDNGHHHKTDETTTSSIILDVDESQSFDRNKLSMNLNVFSRHESTNASLLVEAALDSVSDIQIAAATNETNLGTMDISNPGSCDDTLVNNLYPLPPSTLAYSNQNAIGGESMLSPSVNDHISVTDDLNDAPAISMDYTLHQDDFSPTNSPSMHQQSRSNFMREFHGSISPSSHTRRLEYNVISDDAGNVSNDANFSSDDSNGAGGAALAAQNLSINNAKEEDVQLDLSMYKSHYNIDSGNFFVRRNLRSLSKDKKHGYGPMSIENALDMHNEENKPAQQDTDPADSEADMNNCNPEHKHNVDFPDLDARKQLDLKNYDIYTSDIDFRSKSYDLVDAIDSRTKAYDNLLESDFRMDRNFEPLILNSSELQGLDMSARTYQHFHTGSSVSGLNRFHHIYSEVDRSTVDLRLSYSPPPPSYPDVLRAVSLDLTPPGRHSVDLSLRSHSFHAHQLAGLGANRILTDHNRLPPPPLPEHSIQRHLAPDTRMLSDHTTNRILGNDQITSRLLAEEATRLLPEQSRLLEQGRLLGDTRVMTQTGSTGGLSPPYTNYSVSPNPFHPNSLSGRPPHSTSPTPSTYHHYSAYY